MQNDLNSISLSGHNAPLAFLLDLINSEARFQIPMILIVDGLVIAGLAVPEAEYLEAYAEQIPTALTDALRTLPAQPEDMVSDQELEAMRENWRDLLLRLKKSPAPGDSPSSDHDLDQKQPRRPQYIYLKDVRVLVPRDASFKGMQFPYWQIQLAKVSAWIPGTPS